MSSSKKGISTQQLHRTLGDGSKSPSKKKKMTSEEQSAQFIKTARELDCDESGEAFEKLVKATKLK